MKILDRISNCLSRNVVFITLESIVKTKSGDEYPRHPYDWTYRDGVIHALLCYVAKRVYILSNQDGIELGYIDETCAGEIAKSVAETVRIHTRAKVEYMYCRTMNTLNPMRMPDTGMVDYFANVDSIRYEEALFVGTDDVARECANRCGCAYLDVNDFVEKYRKDM